MEIFFICYILIVILMNSIGNKLGIFLNFKLNENVFKNQ